jgi:3-oxoacyl-[acyl-carrier protein] reductase
LEAKTGVDVARQDLVHDCLREVTYLTEEQKQRIVRRMPLERLASAADVANAVYFLVSEQAPFIAGQILVVDGGIRC